MSVRSATGHYFGTGGVTPAALNTWTLYGISKVNADLGASIQLLSAITYDGGDGTATALYWDATANDMLLLSLDAGTPIGGGTATLASRPATGVWFAWYIKTNGTTTTAGWYNLDTPTAWVSNSCTALNAQLASFSALELNSNSNPTNIDHEAWRCCNAVLSEAQILADVGLAISTQADVFDWRLNSTASLVNSLANGATLTSQGGTLSNGDTYNFPAAVDLDQEGFRFGNDDGDEASFTFAAAQDTNITAPLGANLLLRALVDATGDPANTAYTLRSQKNGSGGYVAVPVGSTTTHAGNYFGGANGGTNPTTSTTVTIPASLPTTCVLSLHFTSRDHTSGTAQPTVSDNNGGAAWTQRQFTTDRKAQWWWKRYEASLSSKTITISGAVGSLSARLVVLEDAFDTGDPFTNFAEETNASGNESHAAITPTNASSAVVFAVYNYANDNAVTAVSAATTGAPGQSTGHLSTGGNDCATHVAVWDNHAASSSGTITWAQTNGTTYSHVYAVRPRVSDNELYVATSANITAGGEATTARLTAPSGKSTSDFVTGRRWDNENGSDSIDITTDDYTEVEWCLQAQSPAADTDFFDFRVYAGGSALDSYGVTPRWTIGTDVDFASTGALSAGSATASGTAVHLTLHATTGALSAQAATVAGSAVSPHLSSGALSAQSATAAGSAAHLTLHTSSGDLTAGSSTIAGTAADEHAATGALASGSAALSAVAAHEHAATGSLSAEAAEVEGEATHLTLHTSSGAISAQAATVSGSAVHPHLTSGALESQGATIAGDAVHLGAHETAGALASQAATIAGAALHPHTNAGAMASQAATVAGSAAHLAIHDATGELEAGAAEVEGASERAVDGVHEGSGDLAAGSATMAGSSVHITLHTSAGALVAGSAAVVGSAAHPHIATAGLVSQAAIVSGSAEIEVHEATGALTAAAALIAGTANRITIHTAAAVLAAGNAIVVGSASHTGAGSDDLYPLAGLSETWPLAGEEETYPLAGQTETFPLG